MITRAKPRPSQLKQFTSCVFANIQVHFEWADHPSFAPPIVCQSTSTTAEKYKPIKKNDRYGWPPSCREFPVRQTMGFKLPSAPSCNADLPSAWDAVPVCRASVSYHDNMVRFKSNDQWDQLDQREPSEFS
jgi:hypothetical protein